ncbi:MAG: hypothetical protein U0264_11760 [Candidatus Kapaibacterium sp.]
MSNNYTNLKQLTIYSLLMTAICFLTVQSSQAGKFSEHRAIGDDAFKRFLKKIPPQEYERVRKLFNIKINDEDTNIINQDIHLEVLGTPSIATKQVHVNSVSYGELNGLSGDHVDNPRDLLFGLSSELSLIKEVLNYHREMQKRGGNEADDLILNSIESRYATLAINDLSHFYKYGKSFKNNIDKDIFERFDNFENFLVDSRYQFPLYTYNFDFSTNYGMLVGTILAKYSLIEKYIVLHTFACELAYRARIHLSTRNISKSEMTYALYFNAFADHFLQDAFSAGHMVVPRSRFPLASISDKALHDFYGKLGLDVRNLQGDSWRIYGDGQMFRPGGDYSSYIVSNDGNSPNYNNAVSACEFSLQEIWSYYTDTSKHSPIYELTTQKDEEKRLKFCFSEYKALSIIPIPFCTSVEEINDLRAKAHIAATSPTIEKNIDYPNSHGMVTNRTGIHLVNYVAPFKGRAGLIIELRGLGFYDNYYARDASFELGLKVGATSINESFENIRSEDVSVQIGVSATYIPQIQSWLDWYFEVGYLSLKEKNIYSSLGVRLNTSNVLIPFCGDAWFKIVPNFRIAREIRSNAYPIWNTSIDIEQPLDAILKLLY